MIKDWWMLDTGPLLDGYTDSILESHPGDEEHKRYADMWQRLTHADRVRIVRKYLDICSREYRSTMSGGDDDDPRISPSFVKGWYAPDWAWEAWKKAVDATDLGPTGAGMDPFGGMESVLEGAREEEADKKWHNMSGAERSDLARRAYKAYQTSIQNKATKSRDDYNVLDSIENILRDPDDIPHKAQTRGLIGGGWYRFVEDWLIKAILGEQPYSMDPFGGMESVYEAKSQHRQVNGGVWYPDLTEFMAHHNLKVESGAGAELRRIYRLFGYQWDNPILYSVRKTNPVEYADLVKRIRETRTAGIGAYRFNKDVVQCHKGGFFSMGGWAIGFPDIL